MQQWLAEQLGVEAEYHALYQRRRYRLKAKLKVARPHPPPAEQRAARATLETLHHLQTKIDQ
ncbi:hypothetical protein H6F67_08965 [Microcoleus sp. FACHB-1515]|uniref:hypothetical protein n=1 Tax=Cyanophyceae TaxID=3028117 RepID=UPI001689ADA1|nr:hypothetical protein [Microcoleus sp. FACHB-1515]MBD2089981.1 hypothetical protein [Microcoleus sp. FACHB-1515]